MSLIFVTAISILGIILGKLLFKKWFNHLSLYCLIMGGLIFLYELKLFSYPEIVPIAWFFIISSFLSFLLGIITICSANNLYHSKPKITSNESNLLFSLFADDGKVIKNSILFFSVVALFVALQRWWVLIGMFGSVPAVLINASVVYRLNVQQEIKEFIPILPAFVYVAVFLSGIYTAYRGRFSVLTFLPFIGIVLKELTYFGRAELLLTLMEFLFSFILFRHLLNDQSAKFKFSKKNALVAVTLLLVLLIAAASFIRVGRGARENYPGISSELRGLKENMIISPSVYLYLSSDIGVFSKYIEQEKEDVNLGENTFFIFYVFLSRMGIVEKPNFFPPGYHIPMWSNTGTYLRELHADFGIAGIFLIPYLLGLLITWLWFKFYREKSLYVFAFLVYLYLIIGFSFLTLATKLNQWYLSLFIILLYIPLLEKLTTRRKTFILAKS